MNLSTSPSLPHFHPVSLPLLLTPTPPFGKPIEEQSINKRRRRKGEIEFLSLSPCFSLFISIYLSVLLILALCLTYPGSASS